MIITGPNGRSSIAFCTGSVVVPRTSDTTASSCPVIALTTLDFPALRQAKNPMWIRLAEGVSLSDIRIPSFLFIKKHCTTFLKIMI